MLEAFATKISLFSKMFITVTATPRSRVETSDDSRLSAQNKLIKESILSIMRGMSGRTLFPMI